VVAGYLKAPTGCWVAAEEEALLTHSDVALEEKGADLIDDARTLTDQPLTHAVQILQIKLLGGLGGNELHRRPLNSSAIASASRKSFL
jgi:hypothetical protein